MYNKNCLCGKNKQGKNSLFEIDGVIYCNTAKCTRAGERALEILKGEQCFEYCDDLETLMHGDFN